ncbi:Uncharacterised protein [Shigella sonnei]|nr:Uncharacterised protein [Shigella sonnei]
MDGFLHQASFVTGNWCYDRHCSVRLVICFDLAIDQIAQSGLSSLKVIYYSAQLFSAPSVTAPFRAELSANPAETVVEGPFSKDVILKITYN